MNGWIYAVWLREFKNAGQNVIKVGKTTCCERRLKQYPKQSQYLINLPVNDHDKTEIKLLKTLRKTPGVMQRRDIGLEYFEGDKFTVLTIVIDVCRQCELEFFNITTNHQVSHIITDPNVSTTQSNITRSPLVNVDMLVKSFFETTNGLSEMSLQNTNVYEMFNKHLTTQNINNVVTYKRFAAALKDLYGVKVNQNNVFVLPVVKQMVEVKESGYLSLFLQSLINNASQDTISYNFTELHKMYLTYLPDKVDKSYIETQNATNVSYQLRDLMSKTEAIRKKHLRTGNCYIIHAEALGKFLAG
jgi:hypothetical protein